MDSPKKFFLLDAYMLIYRSYYAFIKNPVRNSSGLNTSAMLGFTNFLDEILRNEQPSHIVVVFDPDGPTFRHTMYEKYKAQRPPTPEDIKISVPYIKRILEGFNIKAISVPNYEADDVIGSLAFSAEKAGFKVFMVTSDKDYCQLVTDNILLFKPKRSGNEAELWGVNEIKTNFSVIEPRQVIDVLGLWGDASDNVPGAPGIGEKQSKELIKQFGSIDNLYKNLNKLKPKQKVILEENREKIELSRFLVTIKTDIETGYQIEDFILKDISKPLLQEVFNELDFRTLAKKIIKPEEKPTSNITPGKVYQTSLFGDDISQDIQKEENESINLKTYENTLHTYHLLTSTDEINSLATQLADLQEFCFDTETTGLEVLSSDLVGLSFCFKSHEAYYIPINPDREKAMQTLVVFKPLFENQNITKIGQNIKFDIMMLRTYGIEVRGKLFDTMLAHYLLNPEDRHNMDYLAQKFLGYSTIKIEELIGKRGNNQGNMKNVALDKIKEYAAEDADITWQLFEILEVKLKENDLTQLFETVEMPLVNVLADMELTGVSIDKDALKIYANELREKIIEVQSEIYKLAGNEFNISSPKQLGEILFEKLKIVKDAKLTKTKQYSTNEKDLQKIKSKHPIIDKILDYRSLTKLLTTYVDSFPKLINSKTNKIHTSYNQAVTSTGRLSSNNPNLQNIPIRTEEGKHFRKAFIPSSSNNVILSADYSQIELRLIAHISNDENMISAFKNGEDIHAATAAKIAGVPISEVTKDMRAKAKGANFGIVYGSSSFGLSENMGISRSEAKTLIDNYFATYPGIKKYMDNYIEFAREHSFVVTIMGRKRWLNDINSLNFVVKGSAERNAINAPIQGSAADIIKLAMINIFKKFEDQQLKTKMIIQVHDELVFDVPKTELEIVQQIVKSEMENVVQLSIPLTVDAGVGNNWLEAH